MAAMHEEAFESIGRSPEQRAARLAAIDFEVKLTQ